MTDDIAARAAAREPPVAPGERVAHYQVLTEIGRGGMGIVFRARDVRLGREVALKCPWRALAEQPVAHERFLREARSASRLSHPNIVPVFEIFRWAGLPWLAMELVDGRSLRALLRETGAVSVKQSLQWVEGLADALRAAHGKGIIHRDVNPNNILLRADGWPLLTDFGLAHVFASDSAESTASDPLTAPGHIVGTRSYMSPEQVMGKQLDPRSDLFSLGAVLYEMCTGRRAFAAEEPGGDIDAILHRQPPALPPDGEFTGELDRIIRKALAKRREERYQDARELHFDVVALRRRADSAEYPLPAPPARARFLKWAGWTAGLAIAAVGVMRIPRPAPHAPPAAGGLPTGTPHQVTSEPGWEAEPALSPDGSLIAYTGIASGNPDIWITDVKGGSRLRLTDDPAVDGRPAWFPDGTALAFVSERGGRSSIWKVPRLGGSAVLLIPDAVDPAVSPDGKRIACARPNPAGESRIVVAPLEDPSRAVVLTGDRDGQWSHARPAWSPDGRTICYDDSRNLWLVGADGGRARRLTDASAIDLAPVFSADGHFVVFSSFREGTRALWQVPVEGGVPERLTVGSGPESQASISRDGSRLAYSTYLDNYDLVLRDLATGATGVVGSVLQEWTPSLAPDAKTVVFASTRRGGQQDLWLQPLSGPLAAAEPRQLTDLSGVVTTPAFSPDGRWVAFKREVEGRREVWIIAASGGIAQRFSDGRGSDLNPAWSPDGAQLAYVSERPGQSHVWTAPIRGGQRVGPGRQLTSGETTDLLPAWSWDGSRIAYVAWKQDDGEVRVVSARGDGRPRVLARGPGFGRLRWAKPTGWLWFSAAVASGRPQLWKVSPDGGDAVPAVRPEAFKEAFSPGDFDLSADARLLAFTREDIRGDVWLLEKRAP